MLDEGCILSRRPAKADRASFRTTRGTDAYSLGNAPCPRLHFALTLLSRMEDAQPAQGIPSVELSNLKERHPDHWMRAAAIRSLAIDAVAAAKSGHTGMPIGMADVATVLFEKHLRFDASAPDWPDRDRFILSAGHGSMLLYSLLHLTGYADMTLEQIRNFRQWNSVTAGHPEFGHAIGIETTTGPLGQGLANSVGFALAEEVLRARYGSAIVDHRTYVIAGDGCLMEGVSQEAITLAGRQRLGRLTVFWDNNNITIDGHVGLADITDQISRFRASGWHVQEINGHDPEAIENAIGTARESDRPSMIACRTHIALGHAAQDTAKGHGALTDAGQNAEAKKNYGWNQDAFTIPDDIKAQWQEIGRRGVADRLAWEQRFAKLSRRRQAQFRLEQEGGVSRRLAPAIRRLKAGLSETAPKLATRSASERALEVINRIMDETIGGSADLTGSNNTRTENLGVHTPEQRTGRYIHYGIREHGMAAVMNGMALHGGVKPYGGTFMVFADYARAAMRLSALMGIAPVYVMTHDSIGLGEDGPTHQPVEHLSMLRATPNMVVIRPADAVETAEAWESALGQTGRPTVLSLTRQGLPTVRMEHRIRNLTAQGAYVLAEATGKRQAILIATGSEVSIALDAREMLQAEGIGTRVVSMPSWELFEEQNDTYRKRILPSGPVRVGIEAGVRHGWDRWLLGERGSEARSGFIGMSSYGASAPCEVLFEKFDITAGAVAQKVRELLG